MSRFESVCQEKTRAEELRRQGLTLSVAGEEESNSHQFFVLKKTVGKRRRNKKKC